MRFEGEDVWLTVEQIMELFDASQQDVSYNVNQIYVEVEQDPERTHKKFLLVRQEGSKYWDCKDQRSTIYQPKVLCFRLFSIPLRL